MDAELYNGYWISTDTYLTQQHRDENAQLIWNYLTGLGWTKEAVAGILGNMDVESSINPALIEGRLVHTLPDNNTALSISSSTGVGLVQWTGDTPTPPAGQKLVSFAIRHNQNWYDGDLQCYRLEEECNGDLQFDHGTIHGVYYDWQVYIASTNTPEELAYVWQMLYERGGTDTQRRQDKARYYFNKLARPPIWLLFTMANKRKELKRRCLKI